MINKSAFNTPVAKLLAPVLTLLLASSLWAQGGKIVGTIIDSETGDALPGVNVVIEGTDLGAATDMDGRYIILNSHPGTYSVRATMIGYAPVTKTDVDVNIDMTTQLNFEMPIQAIVGEEVTVVAERPIIELDLTASKERMSSEEFETSWVQEVEHAVRAQSGVNIHGGIRGSFGLDVVYVLDGMNLRDEGSQTNYKGVNISTIQEMEVLTGGWNAEYSTAQGGIVNLVTKEAQDRIRGSMKYRVRPPGKYHWGGNVYGEDRFDRSVMTTEAYWDPEQTWTTPWGASGAGTNGGKEPFKSMTPAQRAQWWTYFINGQYAEIADEYEGFEEFRGLSDLQPLNYTERSQRELEGTLYGPLTKNVNFLISGRYEQGAPRFPTPLPYAPEWNVQGKLNYKISDNTKLKLEGIFGGFRTAGRPRTTYKSSEDSWPEATQGMEFIQNPYDGDKYWLRGGSWGGSRAPEYFDTYSAQLKFSHIFSPRTYLDIYLKRKEVDYEATFRKIMVTSKFEGWEVPLEGDFPDIPKTSPKFGFDDAGDMNETRALTQNTSLGADFVSQINLNHQIKAGFDLSYQYYHKKVLEGKPGRIHTTWTGFLDPGFNPYEGAAYVQDKIELKGIVVNAGLRLDFFNVNQIVSNYFWDMYRVHRDTEGNIAPGVISHDPTSFDPDLDSRTPTRFALSPRLGISHPITESTVLHFNYGHFYLRPGWHKIGATPYMRIKALPDEFQSNPDNITDANTQVVFSHWGGMAPNYALDYEKMIQYEVGFDQNIANKVRLKMTMFFKDAKDLTNAGFQQGGGEFSTGRQSGTTENVFIRFQGDPYSYSGRTHGKNIGPRVISVNGAYSDTRGLEATFDTRPGFSRYVRFKLNYILSFVTTGHYHWYKLHNEVEIDGVTFKAATDAWRGGGNGDEGSATGDNEYWNPHNQAKLTVNISSPTNFGPAIGQFQPLAKWNLNMYTEWSQGQLFTYHAPDDPSREPNNMRWKDRWRTNARLSKTVDLFANLKTILSVEVLNLFNDKTLGLPRDKDREAYFERDELPVHTLTKEPLVWNYYRYDNLPREIFFSMGFEF